MSPSPRIVLARAALRALGWLVLGLLFGGPLGAGAALLGGLAFVEGAARARLPQPPRAGPEVASLGAVWAAVLALGAFVLAQSLYAAALWRGASLPQALEHALAPFGARVGVEVGLLVGGPTVPLAVASAMRAGVRPGTSFGALLGGLWLGALFATFAFAFSEQPISTRVVEGVAASAATTLFALAAGGFVLGLYLGADTVADALAGPDAPPEAPEDPGASASTDEVSGG